MNRTSMIKNTDPLTQSTEINSPTSLSDDVWIGNVTLSLEEELLQRLATFLTYSIMVHTERIYLTLPALNFIIGLPGSVVSLFVILRMKPFTSSSLYFCVLAVADGLFVVFVLLVIYSWKISPTLPNALCPVDEGIWEILTLFSNFILIVLAGERCLAVWFPLKVALFTSVRKAIVGCTVCGLLVLVLTVHNFIIWRLDEVHNTCAQIGIDGYYEFYLNVWSKVMPFLFSFVPSIVILVLNVIIISGLKKSNDARRLMTARDENANKTVNQSKQVTVMLISISVVFFVTNMPYAIFQIFGNLGGWLILIDDRARLYTYEFAASSLMMTLFTMWRDLNHSLNFLCYFLSTRRFREEFWNLFFSLRQPPKPRPLHRLTTLSSVTDTTKYITCESGCDLSP